MTKPSSRQAILFLTHRINDQILSRFERIDSPALWDKFILLDCTDTAPPVSSRPIVPFDFSQICAVGYTPFRRGKITPGSNHFPVIEFGAQRSEYSFIWVVEFDVIYTGKWACLFQCISTDPGLVATKIRRFKSHVRWRYWNIWNRSSPTPPEIPRNERIASFNPIYRLSRDSIQYLRKMYLEGWCGHHEVTMATLLHRGGFSLEELGGCGEFTPPQRRNRFYRIGDTMRWRPTIQKTTVFLESDMLFHPVKLDVPIQCCGT